MSLNLSQQPAYNVDAVMLPRDAALLPLACVCGLALPMNHNLER